MSLLQNPIKVIDQIGWYIENQPLERFPGAFLIAAGNLSRQLLEQILFILAFYSGMPNEMYMKDNLQLKTAYVVLNALKKSHPTHKLTYLELAKRRGSRIHKFSQNPSSLDKWREEFNEPSHYRNPAARSIMRENHILNFIQQMRNLFDELDSHLITAAVNELCSGRNIKAILVDDKNNTPGVQIDLIVTPKDLKLTDKGIELVSPPIPMQVIPDDKEVPLTWTNKIVLVQHSVGMIIHGRFITKSGNPVNLSSSKTVLDSFTSTPEELNQLNRRLRELGCLVVKKGERDLPNTNRRAKNAE